MKTALRYLLLITILTGTALFIFSHIEARHGESSDPSTQRKEAENARSDEPESLYETLRPVTKPSGTPVYRRTAPEVPRAPATIGEPSQRSDTTPADTAVVVDECAAHTISFSAVDYYFSQVCFYGMKETGAPILRADVTAAVVVPEDLELPPLISLEALGMRFSGQDGTEKKCAVEYTPNKQVLPDGFAALGIRFRFMKELAGVPNWGSTQYEYKIILDPDNHIIEEGNGELNNIIRCTTWEWITGVPTSGPTPGPECLTTTQLANGYNGPCSILRRDFQYIYPAQSSN